MDYWDALPKWLREFLSELPIVMSPVDIYDLWTSGNYADREVFKKFIWEEVIYWMNYEISVQEDTESKRPLKDARGKIIKFRLPVGFWPRVTRPVEPLVPRIGRYVYHPDPVMENNRGFVRA